MTLDFLPPTPDEPVAHAEWLLQSARAGGQVQPEVLAEALAYEHHEWLRRLGAALFSDQDEGRGGARLPSPGRLSPAERLTSEALAAALVEVHAYDAGLGVRPWLAALALNAAAHHPPAEDPSHTPLFELDLSTRCAAILRLLCGFSRDELERVPGLPADWLPRLRAVLLPGAAGAGLPAAAGGLPTAGGGPSASQPVEEQGAEADGDSQPVYPWSRARPRSGAKAAPPGKALDPHEQRLADALKEIYPNPPALPPERLNGLAAHAARRAGRRALRRKQRVAVNEIALVSLAILAVLLVIWGADRLLPPEPDAPRATLAPATPINYNAGSNTDGADRPRQQRQPTNTPLWRNHVAYVVQPGDTLDTIAVAAGVSVDEIKTINGVTESEPVYPGQVLWVHVPAYTYPTAFTEIIQPDESLEAPPPLLSRDASPAAILERLRISRRLWRTFWADYQMVYYGPLRYNSQPRAYRFQVWVSQPDRSLEIFNELSSQPEMRHITLQGRSYTSAVRYSGAYLDPDWNHAPSVLLTNPLLRDIIFPDQAKNLAKTLRMETQGVERVAGRTGLVVAFYELAGGNVPLFRLWIDRRYGLILRRQLLETTTDMVISDMVASQIYIDNPMPAALFNPLEPWEGGFATGPSGETAPLDALPPTPTWALPASRALP